MTNPLLNNAELEELAAFLQSDATSPTVMSLDTLHGFLTALAIAPSMAQSEAWLSKVWSEAEDEPPYFVDAEEEQHVVGLILHMLDAIRTSLNDPEFLFEPLVAVTHVPGGDYPDGEMWSVGFMEGVAVCMDTWSTFLGSATGQKLLHPIYTLAADDLPPAEEKLRHTPKQRARLTEEISEAVNGIFEFFDGDHRQVGLANEDDVPPRLH